MSETFSPYDQITNDPIPKYTHPERFNIHQTSLLTKHVPSECHIEVRLPNDITHIDAATINKAVRANGWKSSEIFPHEKPYLHVTVSRFKKIEEDSE